MSELKEKKNLNSIFGSVLSVYVFCLSVFPSFCLSVYLSVYLSICPSV